MRAPIVAAFDQPNLQVTTDAMRTISDRLFLARINHRHLFPKRADPQLVGGLLGQFGIRAVLSRLVASAHRGLRVTIVKAVVVIVFFPIGRHLGEQLNKARLDELLMPFSSQLLLRARTRRHRVIVVDVVAVPTKKPGFISSMVASAG